MQTIVSGMNIDNTSVLLAPGNVISTGLMTPISDADYSAQPTDMVMGYTSLTASRTVTLTPCGTPTMLKFWRVKDNSGNCTVGCSINLASTSGTFDGLVSTAISTACGSKSFYDDGTNFFMVGSFLPSVNGSSGIQKADGDGGFINAVSGTDYVSTASLETALTPYATSSSVTSGLATKQANITTGTTSQYIRGDLSLATFPTALAPSGTAGGDLTGTYPNPTLITSGVIAGSYTNATLTVDAKGRLTSAANASRATSPLALSLVGTGATGTQISATKDSSISCCVSTSTTSTIGGPSTSVVALKICATNNATEGSWTTVATAENDQTITLAVVLQSTQLVKEQLYSDVPVGWYAKLVNSGTGTHAEGFVSGQQTLYG